MSIGRVPRAAFEFVAKSARSTIQPDRASCLVGEDGFEPSKRNAADLQSVPFGHSGTPPYFVRSVSGSRNAPVLMEPVDGLEPPTY